MTNECNLECRYCIGKKCSGSKILEKFDVDYSLPLNINYTISELKRFIEKDPEPTMIFYGGEPLLEIEKIREIMDNVRARFMLQTNGLLLRELGKEYVHKLHNVMFSIDGGREVTDRFRGKGIYDKVTGNVEWLREIGYKGEILARMTINPGMNLFQQVVHLSGIFDSVHWQLNAGFFEDYNEEEHREFFREYNNHVNMLAYWWASQLRQGKLIKIYPFFGILKDKKSPLRCGAGYAQYAILTNGSISPCPVMGGLKELYVGDIFSSHPLELPEVNVTSPCTECDIYSQCGGRCLYENRTKLWPGRGRELICSSVRNLMSVLQEVLPETDPDELDYDKFNSCEIIP